MTPNDDWTELTRAWTAPSDDDRGPAELAGQVLRRSWLGRLNFWFEMAGCLVAAGLGAWVLAVGPQDRWLLGAAAMVFGLFAGAMTLWARDRGGAEDLETPERALTAAIRQAEAGRRWSRAGVAVTIGAAVFMGLSAAALPIRGEMAVIHGFGGLFLLGCLAFYLRHQDRCARRIARHRRALEALDDPGEAADS